jgi:hypothetical protein
MLKKLELEALQADISNVERLLAARTQDEDPIGYFQLSRRQAELRSKFEAIQGSLEKSASVALFFGGPPVFGSKGIRADFAGRVIEVFQDLVSKSFATAESGTLAERGPVPLRGNAQLMLTDVARGSFGLILEETDANESLEETALHNIVDEVAQTIVDFSSPDESLYETALLRVDSRSLISFRDFFKLLDEQSATVRLVEGERDDALDSTSIHRARIRTEFTKIEDNISDKFVGRLFFLPAHRRFELKIATQAEPLYGTISSDFSREKLEELERAQDVLGKVWKTKIRIRETQRLNQPPKLTYTLMGLIEKVEE